MDISDYNKHFYSDVFASKHDIYYSVHRKKIETVLGLLSGFEGKNALDIGCGDGYITEIIGKSISARMFGVEISADAAKKAKEKGINVKLFDITKGKLPFESDFFDMVFCGDVIEHVYDTEKLLENILDVLRPGGTLILSVPNIASWYNRGFLLIGWLPTWVESASKLYTGNPFMKNSVGHIRAFTEKSLSSLLDIIGFENIVVKGSPILGNGMYSSRYEKIWNIVDSAFARKVSLASVLVASAKKPNK
ncbi:MAG: class I SAM-dependent methyltransferase [Candidatus Micrarchaeota archaeon]|nr:class I SAM-dependent methyltransferase [Candidatus Micrarchaeota archaeon]